MKYPVIQAEYICKFASYLAGFEVIGIEYTFPLCIVKDKNDTRTIRHECIHFEQMWETSFIGFILLYIAEYLWGRLKGLNHYNAYKNIIFEREANAHEHDENYLENRKRFAWYRS